MNVSYSDPVVKSDFYSSIPLGTLTKLRNPPQESHDDSPLLEFDPKAVDRNKPMLERGKLQEVARALLPDERIRFCSRQVRKDKNAPGAVEIWKHKGKASYNGLMRCGSVWTCPVCASKISEKRRDDLTGAVDRWSETGGSVLFLTLTFPHYKNQSLNSILDKFKDARRRFMNRKVWKRFKTDYSVSGTIRALEVTHGSNGWHPHSHELVFIEPAVLDALRLDIPRGCDDTFLLEQIRKRLLISWQSACVAAGLPEPNHHGLTVQDGSKASEYVSKWGISEEMTKSHVKRGRKESRTPWDLLRSVSEFGAGTEESLDDMLLFQEFAAAFKGSRQLHWSRGLRDLLALDPEMSDQDIVDQAPDEPSEKITTFTVREWKVILRAGARWQMLDIASREGEAGCLSFLDDLKAKEKYRQKKFS